MIRFPKAKINIGLHITARRKDGYHQIESIFYPIPLCDVLEVLPDENQGIHLEIRGIELPNDGAENLVVKAYRKLAERVALPGVKAALLKNIPTGAGLGGGSSDASAMLRILQELTGTEWPEEELIQLAAELGSDCPFFLHEEPAFVSGRGEELEPIGLDLSNYHMVLVYPHVHVSTAKAYSLVNPTPPPFDLRKLPELPIEEWKHHIRNDFESGIFELHPQLRSIKEGLYALGAVYASMSGSGSSVYGIFKTADVNTDSFKPYFLWQSRLD